MKFNTTARTRFRCTRHIPRKSKQSKTRNDKFLADYARLISEAAKSLTENATYK